jgi:hypothetical protein
LYLGRDNKWRLLRNTKGGAELRLSPVNTFILQKMLVKRFVVGYSFITRGACEGTKNTSKTFKNKGERK